MSYSRSETINCVPNNTPECSIEAALSILGGKWKLKIYKLLRGKKVLRFSELKSMLEPISDKTLSAQLREMEYDQLLFRKVYPVVPPKVEYSLTELGSSMEEVFLALEKWGGKYLGRKNEV